MTIVSKAALHKGLLKVERMEKNLKQFPHITKSGEWLTHENGHWTGGFWTGLLWLKSMYGNDPETLKTNVMQWVKKLAVRKSDNKTHDQGFIFGPSCILGHRMTGEPELVEMAAAGAKNMSDLYEDRVGLILAWDEPGYEGVAIVDTIMNLPLMIWVADQTNQPEYRNLACNVADQILRYHIRPDDSIYHVVRWDTETFEVVERTTHQGFAPDSCWSRGQAWATYGFANMYRYTGNREYLAMAIKLGDYFWNHLDNDIKLPRWDFIFKNQGKEPIDASAASIAASGMLLIADLLKRDDTTPNHHLWSDRAEAILSDLIHHCLYTDIDRYGIIEKATVDKPRSSGIGESTMYGDYYFMEALHRLVKGNPGDSYSVELLY